MKGIINIGNSCYMNSALQLLFNSNDLCRIILTANNNDMILLSNNIKDYHNNNNNSFNPTLIKQYIDKITKQFRGSAQQDSSEFIIYFLDIIDKYSHSSLYNFFGIETTINIKCKKLECLTESIHIENDLFLHLDILPNLDDSYRQYKSIVKLVDNNSYKCEKCNKYTIGRKKIQITKWPSNLIIVLKRFNNMMRKDNTLIKVPLEWRHEYKLMGGIIHMGDTLGGHYISYGKKNNNWFIANDNKISLIDSIETFMERSGSQSYILHYMK